MAAGAMAVLAPKSFLTRTQANTLVMAPQFQEARVIVSTDHPIARAAKLPRMMKAAW